MGELVHMHPPELRWPFRTPFRIEDQRNKMRGQWFYRSAFTDSIWGPFKTKDEAETMMWVEGNPQYPA